MIPTKTENPFGLHVRYQIRKIIGYVEAQKQWNKSMQVKPIMKAITEPVDPNAEYFVLRLDGEGEYSHVMACREAINAYADAIQEYRPQLANELRSKYPVIS